MPRDRSTGRWLAAQGLQGGDRRRALQRVHRRSAGRRARSTRWCATAAPTATSRVVHAARARSRSRRWRGGWSTAAAYDAVICLGCVIRGATPHFDYVAGHAANGIAEVAMKASKCR